jgi:hypothetical protein
MPPDSSIARPLLTTEDDDAGADECIDGPGRCHAGVGYS